MIDLAKDTRAGAAGGRGMSAPVSTRAEMDKLALGAVYEIAKTFSTAPDPIDVVPDILNVLSSFLDLRHGVLALLTDPGDERRSGDVNPYRIAATAFVREPDAPDSEVLPDDVARIVATR